MTGQTGKIGTNISEELFKYAGLEIRFLLTSSDCNGTMSVFEFSVPASFKIPGPAHIAMTVTKRWSMASKVHSRGPLMRRMSMCGPERHCAFRGVRLTAGQTTELCPLNNSLSSVLASWDPNTSGR